MATETGSSNISLHSTATGVRGSNDYIGGFEVTEDNGTTLFYLRL